MQDTIMKDIVMKIRKLCKHHKGNIVKVRKDILINHLRNPRVNPADILPVTGIPKLVIANEEAIAE